MSNISVGSICSGIEAASVAWRGLGFDFKWFSEIGDFPSRLLKQKYPNIPNLGDMTAIPDKIEAQQIDAPDLICGGTPCQAFSLAGWKKGLEDDRGNLTLKFVDIVEANDEVRSRSGNAPSIVLWENVEGVLKDKTNAFGCFVSSLAGFDQEIELKKWPSAGVIHGTRRNVAWRVLDAKFFGLPQQRKRLYVLAGGKNFFPENILFELGRTESADLPIAPPSLQFTKQGRSIEVFRHYTDCLYSAYGTKWNGNAAAYNGSLFVAEENRLRRFTPLECERLMGFPDGYTDLPQAKPTNRYQAVGNSWAVPVIRWLGIRINERSGDEPLFDETDFAVSARRILVPNTGVAVDLSLGTLTLGDGRIVHSAEQPLNSRYGNLFDVIDVQVEEKFYITPVGCKGILRRRAERDLSINPRLRLILRNISSQWTDEKIEEISRKQTRGKFSSATAPKLTTTNKTLSLFSEEVT